MVSKIVGINWCSQKIFFTVILVSALLSGCSFIPDSLNPVKWYSSSGDVDYSKSNSSKNDQENSKLSSQKSVFPKLSSVPKRPKNLDKRERDTIKEGLVKDNVEVPKYSDEVFPRQDSDNIEKNNMPGNQNNLSKNEFNNVKSSNSIRIKRNETNDQSIDSDTKSPNAPEPSSQIITKPKKSKLQNNFKLGNMGRIPSYNPSAPRVEPVPRLPLVQNNSIMIISGNGVNELGNYTLNSWSPRLIREGRRGSIQVATILFANGSSKIKPRDRRILRQVIDQFRKVGGKLRIIGHASRRTKTNDPVRHKMSNFWVSTSRAEKIANELIRMGVNSNNLLINAVSDREPRYHEYMPSGEAGNRRAEIFIDF